MTAFGYGLGMRKYCAPMMNISPASRLYIMEEQATARLFGWSLGCLFLAMLALNAVAR
jgi:hypothetical protein